MGPCLCGDPYCSSCGNPALAELEAAEEIAMEAFEKAKLTPEEYCIVVTVGLVAVAATRKALVEARNEWNLSQREYEEYRRADS